MRSLLLACSAMSLGLFAVACAHTEPTSTTTVTSASIEPPVAKEPARPAPKGVLVCKANSVQQGTIEVWLDWKGNSASGTLRRKTLAGDYSETELHAEKIKGSIVADDVHSQDLVVHAAMLRDHKGKKYVRLGDAKQGWTLCE